MSAVAPADIHLCRSESSLPDRSARSTSAIGARSAIRADDLLMHPALLEAAEASMGVGTAGANVEPVRHAFLVSAGVSRMTIPVGAACVTEYPLDTMVFASPLAQRVVAVVRRLFPSYLKFRVTFCGLPISTAGSNVRVAEGADADCRRSRTQ